MDIYDFLYKNELLNEVDDDDIDFIKLCYKDGGEAKIQLLSHFRNLEASIASLEKELNASISRLEDAQKGIVKAIKSFLSAIKTDGIWSSVSDEESKKRILRGYYDHISELYRIKEGLFSYDENLTEIENISACAVSVSKRIRLFSLVCGEDGAKEFSDASVVSLALAEKYSSFIKNSASLDMALEEYSEKMSRLADASGKGNDMKLPQMRALAASLLLTVGS